MKNPISLEQYLELISTNAGDQYGQKIRGCFTDNNGQSELAMLESPTNAELRQLRTAVAIMTPKEKQNAAQLTDEQIERIAKDAQIDPANFAIFINGYTLLNRKH